MQFVGRSLSNRYNWFKTRGIKYLTRLSLGLCHLPDHNFKHSFLGSLNPICSCGLDIETTCHYLRHCPNFINQRTLLINNVSKITKDALPSCETLFVELLYHGDDSSNSATITLKLNASIEYILSNRRFAGPFLYNFFYYLCFIL